MKVLVIGAGVGGLAAARGLLAAGHDVEVHERGPALRTSGAALTLWANGTGALTALGASLDGVGAPIDVLEQRDASGRTLVSVDTAHAARRYGLPNISLPRRRLVERLAAGLPDGTVAFGRACTGIAHDAGGVRAEFADGATATGDMLVGADGARSIVRRTLWGRDPAEPSGWATWQGLSRVPIDVVAGRTGLLINGPEGVCGLMPAGEDLLQWWFDRRWTPGEPEPPSVLDDLRARFGHWAAPVPQVLASVADEEIEFFPHHRHRVPDVWGEGRCTLVGDAAHTMPPTQAQGANQALEDAWALSRVLAEGEPADVPAALRRYERGRSRKAARIARVAATEATDAHPASLTRLLPDRFVSWAYTRWLASISDYLAADGAARRAGARRTGARRP
ncbi:FAD-dependent oxidoreductase [Actinomadura rifamycini]|uniref:FAD-dependent oxidoreductase n=1 Tax=Actinomadura rifamycini TaxID=31962 RepID=UPI0003FE7D1F|nr:NAD(P)/FAD-dependent oxidoreductase [Actinomadura rifamycini]